MNNLALAVRQVRYENRSFWRNPAAAFFTFLFPIMFVVLFNILFSGKVEFENTLVPIRNFYSPALIGFAVISACYTNIAMGTTFARDRGSLKRARGTPLPPWAYLFGRIAQALVISLILVVVVTVFSRLVYGVPIPTTTMPAFLVSLAFGAACFCSLGLAITPFIPNADAAPAIVNASILPLLFISNVFIPLEHPPAVISAISNVFPVKHLSHALLSAFLHPRGGSGLVGIDLLVLGVWALVGIVISIKFFSWEPRT
jgi:ABC-2 type transport system permease protein